MIFLIADCRLLIANCYVTIIPIGNLKSIINNEKEASREQTRLTSVLEIMVTRASAARKPFVVALHLIGDSPADLAAATNSLLSRNNLTSFGDLPLSTTREVLASISVCLLLEVAPLQILFKDRILVRGEY